MLTPVLVAFAALSQSTLVQNGSFTSATSSWSQHPSLTNPGAIFSWEASHAGQIGVAKITVPQGQPTIGWPQSMGWPSYSQNYISTASLSAGDVVELRCRVFQNSTRGGVGLVSFVEFYDNTLRTAESQTRCHINGKWCELVTWCEVPQQFTHALVWLGFQSEGEVWLDDVQLVRVANAPGAPPPNVTLTATTQIANSSLIGFGAEDDGYFYNNFNVQACNPGSTAHTAADIAIRAERIRFMNPDCVRMFFNDDDWMVRTDQLFRFDFDGALEGWQANTNSLNNLRTENGALVADYVPPTGGFDPFMYAPGGMEIPAATDKWLVLNVDVQANTSAPVTFEFFFESPPNVWNSFRFPVTPNLGMQELPPIDITTMTSQWTGTVSNYRIDPGIGADLANLLGHSVKIDFVAVASDPANPTSTPYRWTSNNMESHYRSLDDWQKTGTAVNIVHVGWAPASPQILYDNPLRVQQVAGDLLKHLIVTKGYTCIKFWTLANEPNHYLTSNVVRSFDRWTALHQLVRQRIAAEGLQVQMIGSDDAQGPVWFQECVTNTNHFSSVDAFSTHRYPNKLQRRTESFFFDQYMDFAESVLPVKPVIIGECAITDERVTTSPGPGAPNNPLMTEYDHALWTTEYMVRALDRGIAGASIWTLHDMLYLPTSGLQQFWGVWGYKNAVSGSGPWPIYPTYHALGNFTRLTNTGDTVFRVTSTAPDHVDAVVVGNDAVGKTMFWYNTSDQAINVSVSGFEIQQLCIIDASTVGTAFDRTGTTTFFPGSEFQAPAKSFGWARGQAKPAFDSAMAAAGFPPLTTDLNGGFALVPNGMLDANELALIVEILRDPRVYPFASVDAAWRANYDRLGFDANGLLSADMRLYLAGLITLGDPFTFDAARHLCQNAGVVIAAGDYDLSAAWALSIAGDADTDGVVNGTESASVNHNRDKYVIEAMVPELDALLPPGFDINGPNLTANGIEDADELALTAAILKDSSMYGHEGVKLAYHFNRTKYRVDRGLSLADPQGALGSLYMTLGDTDSANVSQVLFGLSSAGYQLDQAWALSVLGDADADTLDNATEHASAGDRATFLRDALVPNLDAAFAALSLPANLDVNGGAFAGNGMEDLTEFALMTKILSDSSLSLQAAVHGAYQANRKRFRSDTNLAWGDPWGTVATAYMTLGDSGSTSVPQALWGVDPGNYNTSNWSVLAAAGDADYDGRVNLTEFVNAGGVRDAYIVKALDPTQ